MADDHRIKINVAVFKQMLLLNELQGFTWIPADKQLTDSHTKQGASSLTLTLIFENFLYKFIICN